MSASALSATSGLTSSEVEGIAATSCALGAVSALGCVVAVAAAVATREPEAWSFVQEPVLVLLLTDFGSSCRYFFVHSRPGSPACYAQATLGQFFTVASMLWSAVIADVLRRVLIRAQDRAAIERLRVPYHAAVWGCSLFMTILPGALGTFGPAGPWCWIDSSRGVGPSGHVSRFSTVILVIWLSIAYQVWCFLKIRVFVERSLTLFAELEDASAGAATPDAAAAAAGERSLRAVQRLFVFPLVIVAARFWGTINRIHNWAAGKGEDEAALYYLHAIPLALQGALHAAAVLERPLRRLGARCLRVARPPPSEDAAPMKGAPGDGDEAGDGDDDGDAFEDVDLGDAGDVELV